MSERQDDPTDHARTSIPRAGEAMKDNRSLGGYLLLGLAVLALVICLFTAARGATDWAIGAGIIAALAAATGAVWVYLERRRVGRVARQTATDPESLTRTD